MNPNISINKDNNRKTKPWIVRWYSEYDVTAGKRNRLGRSFARKIDANRFAQQLREDYNSGLPTDMPKITINELIDKFIKTKRNKAAATVDGYIECRDRLLMHFNTRTPIKNIRTEDAEAYISNFDYISERCKNKGKIIADSTVSRHLRQINSIFNKAVKWNYITKNPFDDISLGKIRTKDWHLITVEEFNNLLNAIDALPVRRNYKQEDAARKIRMKAFYSVMYGCGLRFGEAVNLVLDPTVIDFSRNQITIKNRAGTKHLPSFNVKDYETRCIPMPDWVMRLLMEAQEVADEGCPYIFLSSRIFKRVKAVWKKMLKEGNSNKWHNKIMMWHSLPMFKRHCKRAGIRTDKKLNLHCLRKGYGTNLANMNTPVHTLKELMGHSSILTTMKYYVQSIDENKKKAVEGLERMMEIEKI